MADTDSVCTTMTAVAVVVQPATEYHTAWMPQDAAAAVPLSA